MIYAINTRTEYGKGSIEIYPMPELTENGGEVYAHSLEQALTWAKGYPLYAGVEPTPLMDGRFVLESAWQASTMFSIFFMEHEEVTHARQVLTIFPVNTVYETTGHKH